MASNITPVAEQCKNEDPRKVETIRRISKLDWYIIECPASPREMNFREWRSKITARVDIKNFFYFLPVFLHFF